MPTQGPRRCCQECATSRLRSQSHQITHPGLSPAIACACVRVSPAKSPKHLVISHEGVWFCVDVVLCHFGSLQDAASFVRQQGMSCTQEEFAKLHVATGCSCHVSRGCRIHADMLLHVLTAIVLNHLTVVQRWQILQKFRWKQFLQATDDLNGQVKARKRSSFVKSCDLKCFFGSMCSSPASPF